MNALALILTVTVLVGAGHTMPVNVSDDAEEHANGNACNFDESTGEFFDRVCAMCAQRSPETHAHRLASCRYLLATFCPVSHGISF
jgi:hypothetical protein